MMPEKGRKRRADLWTHFTFDGSTNKTLCELCGRYITGKNTTNLKRHLQLNHTDIYATIKNCFTNQEGATLAQCETLLGEAGLEDMKEHCAPIEEIPSTSETSSSTINGKKRKLDDDSTLQTFQVNLRQSGQREQLSEPGPVSKRATFINFVRDSLLALSKPKYMEAKAAIWDVLCKLDTEDESSSSNEGGEPALLDIWIKSE